MTAALLSLSKMAIIKMKKGNFDQLYIKGSNCYLLVMQIDKEICQKIGIDLESPSAVLIVSTTKEVRFGLILLGLRRIF